MNTRYECFNEITMKLIPFSVIKAAKENDPEAAEKIRKHYDSYIGSRCLQSYTDFPFDASLQRFSYLLS